MLMFAKLEGGQLHLDRHILPYRFSFGFHPSVSFGLASG